MAESTGGLPLDEFNNKVPPGWKPGMTHYPYRRFTERLKLWYRATDLRPDQLGPAVAGRLRGRPFNLALALKVTDQLGVIHTGDEALAFPGQAAGADPHTGVEIPAVPSGLHQLLRVLDRWYGEDKDTSVGEVLDTFFDLRRGRSSLVEYISEHEYAYEEAKTLGGLEINEIGLSHFLMKGCGVSRDRLDHIMLLVNNDRRRYHEIKQHLMKLGKVSQPSQAPGPHGYWQDDQWYEDDWGESSWNEQYWDDSDWDNSYWGEADWPWNGSQDWNEGDWHDDAGHDYPQATPDPLGVVNQQPTSDQGAEDYYGKGKGKKGKNKQSGKGPSLGGCGNCGNADHKTDACPFPEGMKGKGKGKKGFGKPKGKQKGKPKGKGKGKKGKRRAYFEDENYDDENYYGTNDSSSSSWTTILPSRTFPSTPSSSTSTTTTGFARPSLNFSGLVTSDQGPTDSNVFTSIDSGRANAFHLQSAECSRTSLLPSATRPSSAKATTVTRTDTTVDGATSDQVPQDPESFMPSSYLASSASFNNADTVWNYHSVRGEQVWGMVYDPGAAKAMCGINTLTDYVKDDLWPNGLSIKYEKINGQSFYGIDGVPNQAKQSHTVPIMLGGVHPVEITCDTIGGTASKCPFLYPNSHCIKNKVISCSNYYDNGDGLLIYPNGVPGTNGKPVGIRLLLTDSGHYLIPIGRNMTHVQPSKDEFTNVLQAVNDFGAVAKNSNSLFMMSDTNFWSDFGNNEFHVNEKTRTSSGRSIDGGTAQAIPIGSRAGTGNKTTLSTTTTTKTKMISLDSIADMDIEELLKLAVDAKNKKKALTKNGLTSNQVVLTQATSDQVPVKVEPPPGLQQHELDPSDDEPDPLRYNRCANCASEQNANTVLPCSCCRARVCNRCRHGSSCVLCAGKSEIVDDEDDSYAANLVTIKGKRYLETGDQPSSACSRSDLKRFALFKDEYYQLTNDVALTPENASALLAQTKPIQWDFWELFSGSAILSASSKRAGLRVGPPIDARHGWNLALREHQKLSTRSSDLVLFGVLRHVDCGQWRVLR